jgi:hypothetical protein
MFFNFGQIWLKCVDTVQFLETVPTTSHSHNLLPVVIQIIHYWPEESIVEILLSIWRDGVTTYEIL